MSLTQNSNSEDGSRLAAEPMEINPRSDGKSPHNIYYPVLLFVEAYLIHLKVTLSGL